MWIHFSTSFGSSTTKFFQPQCTARPVNYMISMNLFLVKKGIKADIMSYTSCLPQNQYLVSLVNKYFLIMMKKQWGHIELSEQTTAFRNQQSEIYSITSNLKGLFYWLCIYNLNWDKHSHFFVYFSTYTCIPEMLEVSKCLTRLNV